jgi:hypothetical protein
MQRRAVRLTILALLVVAALGAAFLTWQTRIAVAAGLAAERAIERRLDRLSAATAELGASQQAYVAPGQQRGDALTRASLLVQQIYDDIAGLRADARSTDAPKALLAFGQAMDALVHLDDRVRDHLRLEQELMAADLIYTEARQTIDTMTSQLEKLKEAELQMADAERSALAARGGSTLAGAALIWLVGVLALVRVPRMASTAVMAESQPVAPVALGEPQPAASSVDLNAAARVCGELSRLSGASGLARTLAGAARVLDASGIVVWLGAGEELFPAIDHGYGPKAMARLGPIARGADNATATAWRTGETAVVPGDGDRTGAIVVPLRSPSGCFGVLAAEVRHGRERDASARAVAMIIGAQLSAAIAPWPAPSKAEGAAVGGEAAPAPASGEGSGAEPSAATA